ncbi:MAG: hypothetical protein IJW67_13100 [Blautia sp.]|nr:hypothetical protein [Blautia sp.]
MPDERILRLSDSFPEGEESDIEVRVRMININPGKNRKILDACEPLREYSWLIEKIRENVKRMDLENAVDQAINEMPEEFVLKRLLIANRTEVKEMLLTEYNEAETMEMFKEEGRAEGHIEELMERYEEEKLLKYTQLNENIELYRTAGYGRLADI